MKTKNLCGVAILAIATVSVINVNFNSRSNNLSGIALENVEALAQESGGDGGCKWKNIQCPFPIKEGYGVCVIIGDGSSCPCGDATHNPPPC